MGRSPRPKGTDIIGCEQPAQDLLLVNKLLACLFSLEIVNSNKNVKCSDMKLCLRYYFIIHVLPEFVSLMGGLPDSAHPANANVLPLVMIHDLLLPSMYRSATAVYVAKETLSIFIT